MSDDLIRRLRDWHDAHWTATAGEAADTIERLERELAEAKRQLAIVEASNDRMAKTLEYGGKDWPPYDGEEK
jgi:hypothetical protein